MTGNGAATAAEELPDFLVKSTLGVAFASIVLLVPYTVNNFIQGRYLLGALTTVISLICAVNSFYCLRGEYHTWINLLGIAPAVTVTICVALFNLGVMASFWAYLGVLSLYFILPERLAWNANVAFMALVLPVAWQVLDQAVFTRFTIMLCVTSIFAAIFIRIITEQQAMLKQLSITDALTGLYNRTLLHDSLEHAINQSQRSDTPVSLIMIDLDHFKRVNDEFGHDVGDTALKSLGGYLRHRFRGSDRVFRIGGEEFLALVHDADERQSKAIAEDLRKNIASLSLVPDRPVTASIGVSALTPDLDWEDWMKRCDDNLYGAKSAGRNRVSGAADPALQVS